MIHVEIPQWGTLELHHAVFDINGTLAVNGLPIPGAADRLKLLSGSLTIHLLTAGTHGNLETLQETFGYPLQQIRNSKDKLHYVQELGPASVVAFGNGANDTDMLRAAALGIAVMAEEGVAISTLQAADILINGPINAVDLLLHPKRLIATLRG